MATTQPLNPNIRIVDPGTGYLTREGFQFLQSLRETVTGGTFQDSDAALDALSALSATPGIVVNNATDTFVKRSIAVGSGLSVANANGVGGNPTVSLDSDLEAIAALSTTAYGRALLELANAAALAALVDSFFLTPTEGDAAYQPLDADLTTLASTFVVSTWSPTLTAVANVDSVTLSGVGMYARFGSRVFGAFAANVDPTAGGDAATQFGFSLPVASNFATAQDLLGAATFIVAQRAGAAYADTGNDRGQVEFASEGTASILAGVLFSYIVI